MANYYDILGVGKSSNDKEIKQAYRDLARKYHPDVNPGDKQAEEKFKKINEAYEVLSNPESKKKYDMYGDNWQHVGNVNQGTNFGGWPFGRSGQAGNSQRWSTDFADFEDLFSGFGNIGSKPRNRYTSKPIKVEITLKEAFSGTTRQISINDSGRTKKIEVTIPAGVDTNNKIKLNPKGMREVVLNISVTPNIKFKRNKNHLYTDVAVAFDDLILGCEIEVEHLMGKIALVIPANSQNKQKFKLHEKGMPIYNGDGARGDLFVVVNAVIPDSMSEKKKQHIVNYRQLKSDN